MQYALLIYSDESTDPQPGTPEFDAFFKGYEDFTKEVQEKGLMKGGDALQSVSTATTVAGPQWPDRHHRWPLCRDQGAVWRLLSTRLQRLRRSHRMRRQDPLGQTRFDRSARRDDFR